MYVRRISDSSYVFQCEVNKNQRDIIITIPEEVGDAETRYNLAIEGANNLIREAHSGKALEAASKTFKEGSKEWRFEKEVKNKSKIDNIISKFIALHEDQTALSFRITPLESKKKGQSVPKANRASQVKRISSQEYREGIRDRESLSQLFNIQADLFSDPFTKLATEAFQKYESHYISKDYARPEECDFILVRRDHDLVLVSKNNKEYNNPTSNRTTIEVYRNYLITEYGQEKVDYLQHLFQINFDEMTSLTPEHIYRINQGLSNIENQDLSALLVKLNALQARIAGVDPDMTLEDFYNSQHVSGLGMTGSERRKLIKAIPPEYKGAPVKVSDLADWLKLISPITAIPKDLSPGQLNYIIPLLTPKKTEIEASFTGRNIYNNLRGWYAAAELGEYKPWIDAHELSEMQESLAKSKSPLEYHEKLAFIISKNHLLREHPTEGFRVGALIRAPDLNGQARWYTVTSCCSNRHGIFCYTLESVGNDPSLPAIKLYRSTASSSYFIDSNASVLNDINRISGPGYEGKGRGDHFEFQFFKDRTIPVWYGYVIAGGEIDTISNLEEMEIAHKNLHTAIKELGNSFGLSDKQMTMKDIFVENSDVLNDLLYRKEVFIGRLAGSRYMDYYSSFIQKYVDKPPPKPMTSSYQEELKKDAELLLIELDKFTGDSLPRHLQTGIQRIKQEVNDNILSPKRKEVPEILFEFAELEREYKKIFKGQMTSDFGIVKGKEILKQMKDKFEAYAISQGENLTDKTFSDIDFSGHSLGGACVGVHMVHNTVDKGRIPLPGHTCRGYFFDDPGINTETNDDFIAFGNKHRKLMKTLGSHFEINRSHEAGDPVPLAGQVHLGSTFSSAQNAKVNKWLIYRAFVNERLQGATHPSIARSDTAHGTRFQEGEHLRTFYEHTEQGADYKKTYYDTYVMGLIDRRGKGMESGNAEQNLKEYQNNLRNLWKLETRQADLIDNNPLRSTNVAVLAMKWYLKSTDSTRGEKYLDDHGVLYVSQNGVESK